MKVAPLQFRLDMLAALRAGHKGESRRLIKASNSVVTPGQFGGLDLDTGRARAIKGMPAVTELRAMCELTTTSRVVSVTPRMSPGDLFYAVPPRGLRSKSRLTLLITGVHARRLQDMTDLDAMAEGIQHYKAPGLRHSGLSPRSLFECLWDELHGAGSWNSNPWIWVYRFNVWHRNVDKVMAQL